MNSVALIGRLTRDPELRYIPQSQMAVANFTLAVDRPMAKEKTADFIRIVVFGKSAENCERYLKKGRLVGVQGRIQTGSYKNQSGETRYTTDIYADRVEFLEWGDKESNSSSSNFERQEHPRQEHSQQERPQTDPDIPEGFSALDDDDDIPF